MSTASRLFSVVGAGYCGSLLYNSQDAVARFGSELSRAVLATVAKPDGGAGGAGGDAAVRALAAEVAVLSRMLAAGAASPRAPSSAEHTRLLLLACAACGVACTAHFDGLAWVSRATFTKGVKTLGSGLTALSSAVARLRASLNERLDLLTGRVEAGLLAQEALAADAAAAAAGVAALGDQLSGVEAKLDAVAFKQEYACRGIHSLCEVVGESLAAERPRLPALGAPAAKAMTLAQQLAAIAALTEQNTRL